MSTYESASIRRFHLGRVDNIRSCSVEAHDWCKAMTSFDDIPVCASFVLHDLKLSNVNHQGPLFSVAKIMNSPLF